MDFGFIFDDLRNAFSTVCSSDPNFISRLFGQNCCQDKRTTDNYDINQKPPMLHLYKVHFILDGKLKHARIPGLDKEDAISKFWHDAREKIEKFGDWSHCELVDCHRCD